MDHYLIGLSLSQCVTDWLKEKIHLDQIKCIYAGTMIAIHKPESVDKWIENEARINAFFKVSPIHIKDFINHLVKYNQLIQPRINHRGMLPVYKGTSHWIHQNKWIDWNQYHRMNQCCPFCGSINAYSDLTLNEHRIKSKSLLQCDNCFNDWLIPFESKWLDYESIRLDESKLNHILD